MKNRRGFTLLELAVVLTILSILLGGGLTILSTQAQVRRTEETKSLLAEAREALIAHFVVNNRLPCPAEPTTPSGDPNAGIARTSCDVTTVTGVLPWATLGLKETDVWGHRFTYRVTQAFTTTPLPNPSSASGNIEIRPTTVGPSTSIATVAAVVVSHGPNGHGGFNTQGTQAAPPVSGANGNDERENLSSSNAIFVSKTPTEDFDDLLTWITSDILYNQAVKAGTTIH